MKSLPILDSVKGEVVVSTSSSIQFTMEAKDAQTIPREGEIRTLLTLSKNQDRQSAGKSNLDGPCWTHKGLNDSFFHSSHGRALWLMPTTQKRKKPHVHYHHELSRAQLCVFPPNHHANEDTDIKQAC